VYRKYVLKNGLLAGNAAGQGGEEGKMPAGLFKHLKKLK